MRFPTGVIVATIGTMVNGIGRGWKIGVCLMALLMQVRGAVAADMLASTLILASHQFPPYSMTPDHAAGHGRQGILPDIVREAAAVIGWRLEVVYVPFKRTDATVASGEAHAVISQKLVGWRVERYRYSRPIFHVEPAYFFFRDRRVPELRRFQDAAKVDVAVVLGDSLMDELSGRGIPATEVPNLNNAVRMLERGRITALLSLRRPVELALADLGLLSKVEMHVIERRPINLALDRGLDWGEGFLRDFDHVLAAMQKDGRIERIAAQYADIW